MDVIAAFSCDIGTVSEVDTVLFMSASSIAISLDVMPVRRAPFPETSPKKSDTDPVRAS